MGPDGRTSGHCCIKSAETGPGSLHSWPVLALQGQLKGPADETSKMVAARGSFPGVELAEGDDARFGHPVPPVSSLRRRGRVQVRGSRRRSRRGSRRRSRKRSCRERGSSRNREERLGIWVKWLCLPRQPAWAGRVGGRGVIGWYEEGKSGMPIGAYTDWGGGAAGGESGKSVRERCGSGKSSGGSGLGPGVSGGVPVEAGARGEPGR